MSVKFKGTPVELKGNEIKINDNSIEVNLVTKDLSTTKIGGAQGKYQILSIVPSLDTGVCAIQTKKFNEKASQLKNTTIYVISMDLPFAQNRFCSTEGIANLMVLSDFRKKEFGEKYGLLLAGSPLEGLLTRAVIIINPEGKVIYKEVCEEITNEPDYESALKAII